MIWLTSDLHLNHAKIIKYCDRPFKDVNIMNETIIENWNYLVKEDDLIYILGDFCFGDARPLLDKLNGIKVLIEGSHDSSAMSCRNKFKFTTPLLNIVIDKQPITLCHYAMRVWHRSHYNSYHSYGHSHGTLPSIGKSMDVGVDTNNFKPYSWEDIKEIIKNKPDNPNLVKNVK